MSHVLPSKALAEAPGRLPREQPERCCSLPVHALLAELALAPVPLVDPVARRVLMADGRARSEYALARPGGWRTLGWRARQLPPAGPPALTRCRTEEVMAVARDVDRD